MADYLRRKWSFRLNGRKQILIKRAQEKEEHVFMKIMLAKLYSSLYDDIKIEVRYEQEQRYKPDLLALDEQGQAIFWGECGEVSEEKLFALLKNYRTTHLCFSKWNIRGLPFEQLIESGLAAMRRRRSAAVDFINFPEQVREGITEQGEVVVDWEEVQLRRWEF